jgi:ABC-2 type transport system ATP-binding protein
MHAIEITNLTKCYGRSEVLSRVSMAVAPGRLFGFLGPNGAGKTTTIRILLGLLRATGGEARVLGRDAWRAGVALRSEVGYLPGDAHFYTQLTGRKTLAFLAGVRRRDCDEEIKRLRGRFELDLDKRVRQYSSGMKQKLGLIQAMMHRPKVLILDEPTSALDPLVRQTLFEELRAVADAGRTVLFSSHTLSEVEALCDEVAILRQGRLVVQERVDTLRARALRRVEIVFEAGRPERLPASMHVLQQRGQLLSATWAGPIPELLGWLGAQRVRDVVLAPPDLEDLFMAYYDEQPESPGESGDQR